MYTTKILSSVALVACLAVSVSGCQAQQTKSPASRDAAVAPIVPATPAEAGYSPYNDDWAEATLRWLRDQDSSYLSILGENTSDEGRRVIGVQRAALRDQARAIIDGHAAGALPSDLVSYFPAR